MQTLSKEQAVQDAAPALVGRNWELFLPPTEQVEGSAAQAIAHNALRQAENIIRAQEERIRALEALALSDALTGLNNRRGFNAAFERELSLARRDIAYGGVLVMVDLDGFKSINDQYGHQAGDAYLCAVAKALQDGVRGTDMVARLGGDEFGILMTGIDEKTGAKRLAKLEQLFNNRSMLWNGKRLALRASFGLAAFAGGDSVETVTQSADIRLYAHKARNKALLEQAKVSPAVAVGQ